MSIYHPAPANMVELLNLRAQSEDVNKLFFLNAELGIEQQMSHHTLMLRAKSIAAKIQRYTSPGDRVLLIYAPGLEFIAAFYACLYAGVIAVPVYPPAEKKLVDKLQAVIDNSEPKLILSTKKIVEQIKKLKLVKALQNISFIDYLMNHFMQNIHDTTQWDFNKFTWLTTDNLSLKDASAYQEIPINPEQIAFLQYTSGSTGQPKGVMVRHSNLLSNLQFINECHSARPDSVCVIWLPPYHDMGLIGGILYPVFTSIPVYLMSPLTFLRDPSTWLRAISQFKGTVTSAPNFAYALCNKKISSEIKKQINLSSMHSFLNGAEPINAKVMDEFSENFASCGFKKEMFMPCYGLAEGTLMATGTQNINVKYYSKSALRSHQLQPAKASASDSCGLISCGFVSDGLIIADPESRKRCNDNEIGEIWLSNGSVAQGYWNQPEESTASFQAELINDNTKKYLRTGDLGFINDKELFVMGRIKDLIIVNGRNHYPHDIERSIEKCHPSIRIGSCAAVNISDDVQEQLAVIVEIEKNSLNLDEIINNIRKVILEDHSLSVYQIALIEPRTLLKTTSGKIRRNMMRNALIDKKLQEILIWNRDSCAEDILEKEFELPSSQDDVSGDMSHDFIDQLKEKIHSELGDILNIEPSKIADDKNFAEFGLDSLMAVELESRLQNHLKAQCHLSEATVINYPTINSLVEHIQTLVAKPHNSNTTQTAFSFISIPERTTKPRSEGLTSLLDTGINLKATEHMLLMAADYIDIVKLGFGTARLYPEKLLKDKIALLKSANIHVCPGGTFFEIARRQDKIEPYFQECLRLGFNCIELSDGIAAIPLDEKIQLIQQAKSYNFTVLSEVGRKDPKLDQQLSLDQRITEITEQLKAGAWKIILEARESGTVGLFNTDTSIKTEDFDRILNETDINNLLFEAPLKHQQAWLINRLGVSVNLANISPRDIMALEALRVSLRADTVQNDGLGNE